MKKIIVYLLGIVLCIIIIPVIFTNEFKTEETSKDIPFDYGEYSVIKLLHVQDGSVEEMDLDKYLYGVVASEMPVSFEIEALKAQAVVARTYTIYQMMNNSKHENASICDSSLCCQAWISKENRFARWEDENENKYWNKILEAVNETKGKIIFYDNKPINAFFHSNSGGITELAQNVWGGEYPYLQIVKIEGENNYSSYASNLNIMKDKLVEIMLKNYPDFTINFEESDFIKINSYTESGRVKEIKIGNKLLSGVDVRKIFSLKSTNFNINVNNDEIIFSVLGHGHGVGLSQCGSDVLAKNGKNYKEIINYYYKDIEIYE